MSVGDLFLACGEQVADAAQHVAARGAGVRARLEAALRRLDRALDVLARRRAGTSPIDVARVGRIAVLEVLAGARVRPTRRR